MKNWILIWNNDASTFPRETTMRRKRHRGRRAWRDPQPTQLNNTGVETYISLTLVDWRQRNDVITSPDSLWRHFLGERSFVGRTTTHVWWATPSYESCVTRVSAHIARGIRMMASFRRLQKGSHIATPVILSSMPATAPFPSNAHAPRKSSIEPQFSSSLLRITNFRSSIWNMKSGHGLVVRVLDSGRKGHGIEPHTGHGSPLKPSQFHLPQFASVCSAAIEYQHCWDGCDELASCPGESVQLHSNLAFGLHISEWHWRRDRYITKVNCEHIVSALHLYHPSSLMYRVAMLARMLQWENVSAVLGHKHVHWTYHLMLYRLEH